MRSVPELLGVAFAAGWIAHVVHRWAVDAVVELLLRVRPIRASVEDVAP